MRVAVCVCFVLAFTNALDSKWEEWKKVSLLFT